MPTVAELAAITIASLTSEQLASIAALSPSDLELYLNYGGRDTDTVKSEFLTLIRNNKDSLSDFTTDINNLIQSWTAAQTVIYEILLLSPDVQLYDELYVNRLMVTYSTMDITSLTDSQISDIVSLTAAQIIEFRSASADVVSLRNQILAVQTDAIALHTDSLNIQKIAEMQNINIIITDSNSLVDYINDIIATSTHNYLHIRPSDNEHIPCFPKGTRILTPTGYRAVETLRCGDLVLTADGRSVEATVYYRSLQKTTKDTAPYIIPAHSFGRNAPPADLRLSPLHAFQSKKNVWQIPKFCSESMVKQYGIDQPMTYYHLECPNFFRDNLVVDGCVVESFAGKQVPAGIKIYTPSRRLGGYTRLSGVKFLVKG
jgi:hypothetical protein